MTDLLALRNRVRAATGADRELDLAIHLGFDPDGEIAKLVKFRRGFDRKEGMAWELWQGSVCFEKCNSSGQCFYNGSIPLPPLTASIDAALALAEKVLPVRWRRVLYLALKDTFDLSRLPLAIIDALLMAKIEESLND